MTAFQTGAQSSTTNHLPRLLNEVFNAAACYHGASCSQQSTVARLLFQVRVGLGQLSATMEVMIEHTSQMGTKLTAHLGGTQRACQRSEARIEELEACRHTLEQEVDKLEWSLAEAIARNEQLTKARHDRPLRSEDLQDSTAPRDRAAPHTQMARRGPHEVSLMSIDRVMLPSGEHSQLSPPVEMAADLVGVAQKFVDDLLDGAGGIFLKPKHATPTFPPKISYDELVALAASLQV
jgi:hypothetical protein